MILIVLVKPDPCRQPDITTKGSPILTKPCSMAQKMLKLMRLSTSECQSKVGSAKHGTNNAVIRTFSCLNGTDLTTLTQKLRFMPEKFVVPTGLKISCS